jgi:hypothetical protein
MELLLLRQLLNVVVVPVLLLSGVGLGQEDCTCGHPESIIPTPGVPLLHETSLLSLSLSSDGTVLAVAESILGFASLHMWGGWKVVTHRFKQWQCVGEDDRHAAR